MFIACQNSINATFPPPPLSYPLHSFIPPSTPSFSISHTLFFPGGPHSCTFIQLGDLRERCKPNGFWCILSLKQRIVSSVVTDYLVGMYNLRSDLFFKHHSTLTDDLTTKDDLLRIRVATTRWTIPMTTCQRSTLHPVMSCTAGVLHNHPVVFITFTSC